MNKRFIIIILVLCFLFAGLLSACGEDTPIATPSPSATQTPVPTPTLVPNRMGAYLDNIYMFEAIPDQAAQQVLDGTLDIYAGGLRIDQLTALGESSLPYESSVKRQYELLINPANTKDATGMINPFSFSKVRSALNLLLDKQYIVDEIFSSGAMPKYQPLIYKSGDYNKNEATIGILAQEYQYDFDAANEIITQVLNENSFEKNEEDGWIYRNELVNIIILIRNDDTLRTDIGEYVAQQLEQLGFSVVRQYVSQSEGNTLWAAGDPTEGLWHIYTGRRTFDSALLNQENVFADYYTSLGANSHIPLYGLFDTDEEFSQNALLLAEGGYESLEQRDEIMSSLISKCNDYSYRIWIADELAYYPYSSKIEFANTMTTRMDIDFLTVYSLKKSDIWGGQLTWGSSSLLKGVINPVNGSTSPSEMQYLNFTSLPLIYQNSGTGNISPLFIKSASITYQNEIAYVNDIDWISADAAEEISVPNDAVISWSEEKDAPIYADQEYMHDAVGLATAWLATYEREKPKDREKIKNQEALIEGLKAIEDRGYLTSNVKYVVEYDSTIFDLKWHDGSAFSIADIIMAFITKTQLINEKSSLYDEYYAQTHAGELDGFKGFKIASENPLVIEYYTDDYSHLTSQTVNSFWLDYGTGQQSWAQAAAANAAVKDKTATYSEGLSSYYGYALLDYVKGQDGFDALVTQLGKLKTQAFVPYEELLLPYINPELASEQYQNILDFYSEYKHMSIGIGPYMITSVDALSPSLALSAFSDFPIESDVLAQKIK